MFDYKLIEAVAMVAREGGFDKAARAIHITQSAVSQRVKLLEELTGQVLIARTAPPRATPAVIFDRKDDLHYKLLHQVLGEVPAHLPTHYVPSVEKFAAFIASGLAYGMLPDQQSKPLVRAGRLIDLSPGCRVSVKLYWHCWNLKSALLGNLTRHLKCKAKKLLER